MTSCDKRLEELLNRAGQTISDLPKKEGTEASEPYPLSALPKANGAAWNWYLNIGADMEDYDSTRSKMVLKLYILHLTDIIDRMEWALDKTLREKAYLRAKCCYLCGTLDTLMPFNYTYVHPTCEECDIEHVPDDWREDDD